MEDLASVVVVAGLPAVGVEKVPALEKIAKNRISTQIKRSGLNVAEDVNLKLVEQEKAFKQFGIIETQHSSEAVAYDRLLTHMALDKKNTLYFMQAERALHCNEEGNDEEELEAMVAAGRRNLANPATLSCIKRDYIRDWFKDPYQREMFVVRAKTDTLVYFFDSATCEPTLTCDGAAAREEVAKRRIIPGDEAPVWTQGAAFWSPLGSYLVTMHGLGARLWAGADFSSAVRVRHRNVQKVLFSPMEDYMATFNGSRDDQAVCIHRVLTQEVIKTMPPPSRSPSGDDLWPLVAWSHDSRFLAFDCHQGIRILQTPDMRPWTYLDSAKELQTVLPYPNSQFAWQPEASGDPILAIWTPSSNLSTPCRLTMLSIPSNTVLTLRNLFSMDGIARVQWQPRGDYCALMTHVSRKLHEKGKLIQTHLEIFRLREKNLPVDSIATDEDIVNVFWSECKDRFALLTVNRKALFYTINKKGTERVASVEVPRETNCICWSPLGTHFVMGSLSSSDGTGILWFGQCTDVDATEEYTVEIIHKDEMNKLTNLAWDPSGRFVTTSVAMSFESVTGYRLVGSLGYSIWSFQGRPLYRAGVDMLRSFQWRPHPPPSLDYKARSEIRNRMKEYSKKLDAIDSAKRQQRKQELLLEKQKAKESFDAHLENGRAWLQSQQAYAEWKKSEKEYDEMNPYKEAVIETEEEISFTVKPTNVPSRLVA